MGTPPLSVREGAAYIKLFEQCRLTDPPELNP
jgi:hypothetical protein